MPKIEMIIEYTTDGTDYQYNDNHGVLTRCIECKYWEHGFFCKKIRLDRKEDDYCSKAEKRCEE